MLNKASLLFAILALAPHLTAHPIPEVSVRNHVDEENGTLEIRVEVDPRVYFDGDPEEEPYLKKWVLDRTSEEEKAEMLSTAGPYIKRMVKFMLSPEQEIEPKFTWSFGKLGDDGSALKDIDDEVVMIGTWTMPIPANFAGYYIIPAEDQKFSTVFEVYVDGEKQDRYQVLFGGEKSYVVSLD